MNTLAELLHRMIDLLPWREEAHKLEAHSVILAELEGAVVGAEEGAHAAAEAAAVDAPAAVDAKSGKTA